MRVAPRTPASQVVAASVLFGIALVWYSFLVPMWRAPDEVSHVDLVLDVADDGSYPAWDANFYRRSVLEAAVLVVGPLNRFTLLADSAPTRADRPSLDDLGGDAQESGALNHMAQHPPVYYGALGLEYRALAAVAPVEDAPADRTLSIVRLLNLPIVMLLPAVCWWTARRAGLDSATAAASSLIPLCIPGLAHIGSAVNNDNLLTLLSGLVVALAVGVARGDDRLRTAVALGGAIAVALLTKAFAVVLLPLALAAYALGAKHVADRRSVVRAAAACLALAAVGSSWYVLSAVRYGSVLPSLDAARFESHPPGFSPSFGDWLNGFGSFMAQGFWGRPGTFDVKLPNPYTTIATICLLVLVGLGLVRLGRARRGVGVLLLWVFPATLVMVGANSYRLYAASGKNALVHGRYLMPAVVGLAVLAAHGLRSLLGERGRWAVPILLTASVVMHRMSVLRIMERYWGEPDATLVDRARAAASWSPWPGAITAGLAVLSSVAAAWAAHELLRARSPKVPALPAVVPRPPAIVDRL